MNPERWARVEEIFQEALDCPPAERASFIEEQCGSDSELRAQIENLVGNHSTGNPFLESPIWTDSLFFRTTLKDKIAESIEDEIDFADERDTIFGQRIGAYWLEREIGRGGMGIVFLATRAEDFRQKVAIKIVKRGMDTDFILRRFRQERQVLAALEHPNIARLLDGGTTEDGRPFLVMEYIEGLPIDRFCDEHKLTISARLKLFREVCAAVAYSHQRLIIHRDIKPSNVLVTADGTPKLLDFGIAKLLDPTLAPASYQPTATHARMLTPDYASPEQLRGEEVMTVSDVYSLGVLLYFLLTGHLPFNFAAGQPDAFARIVSEQNPERPSAVVTRSGRTTSENTGKPINKQSSTEVADNRRTQPERLRRYLADDLDNIVLKALHKEPARRYSSVEQLSEDINRHLEGLPVKARGDNFVYKARKFVQRHKTAVLATAFVMMALVGGIAATAWQNRIANQERNRAEAESERAKRRFDESRRLIESLMFELDDTIRDLQGATPARELLAKKILEHLDSLAAEASGDTGLQSELAIAYINLGNIQGNPFYPNLGDTAGALESYRKAEKLTETLSSADPENASLRRRFWLTQIRIGDVLAAQGNLQNAQKYYAQGFSVIENLLANNLADESLRGDLASSFDRQGNLSMKSGNFQEALFYYMKALAIFEQSSKARPGDDGLLRAVAAGHGKIGATYLKSGEPKKALESYKKLLQINESRLEKNPTNAVTLDDVGGSRREFGDTQAALGDYRGASENYRRQLQIYEQLTAADPANVKTGVELAISHQRLGNLQTKNENFKSALAHHEKALTILRELESKNQRNTFVINQLPSAYYYLGEANFALALLKTPVATKTNFLRSACSFFKQSSRAYSELSAATVPLPESVKQPSEIEKRVAECNLALAGNNKD
jgi:non-specific serine/threonine protein kinase/serine/threonine-protein kinase